MTELRPPPLVPPLVNSGARQLRAGELGLLERALANTPSVGGAHSWSLSANGATVRLFAPRQTGHGEREPTETDRLLSSGAALTTVELSLRALGRQVLVRLSPNPMFASAPNHGHGAPLAELETVRRAEAELPEAARYAALFRRRVYHAPFAERPVPDAILNELTMAPEPVSVTALSGRAASIALAEELRTAAELLRADHARQRELIAWSTLFGEPTSHARNPIRNGTMHGSMSRASTRLPSIDLLAARLRAETLLLVHTPGGSALERVLAGATLHRTWLTGVANGLAGSLVTGPLRLDYLSERIAAAFGVSARPWVLLRLGYPAA